jgi:hypothetical protein
VTEDAVSVHVRIVKLGRAWLDLKKP